MLTAAAVLTFWDAQVRAREMVRGKATDATKPITVAEALDEHEIDLRTRGGLVGPLRRVRDRLSPALLARPVGLLVVRELRHYRDGELARGLKPASVTRLCKAFAAALNFVADHDPSIGNRAAWRIGLAALPDSNSTRVDSILSDDQVRAVVAACYGHCPRLGLFIETLAVFGCRPIQAARLVVGDLQVDRILMPSSAKGRGRKRIDRRPLPLPAALAAKLRIAAGDRIPEAPLLLRADGVTWHVNMNRYFRKAMKAAGLSPAIEPYALRHSSIVRSLLRGLPTRLVADAHNTSVAEMERTYSKYIADHSDAALRTAQIDMAPLAADPVVVSLRRP